MTTATLHTNRLMLRAPTRDDLDAYRGFYAVSDVKVGLYRGDRSDTEITDILQGDLDQWRDLGWGMFLVRESGADTVLGGVGLKNDADWGLHELTWWLMPNARGRGLATEAARAIVDWAYGTLGWDRVQTFMRDKNIASRAIAERLGGRVEQRKVFPDGVTRDVFMVPRPEAAA